MRLLDRQTGFDLATLRQLPEVSRTVAHASRSAAYEVVTTSEVLRPLYEGGYRVTEFQIAHVRDRSRNGAAKHMVRLRHSDDFGRNTGTVAEVVIMNSYDGSCAWRIHGGFFRFVCANGLVVGERALPSVAVRHIGSNVIDDVMSATHRMQAALRVSAARLAEYEGLTVDERTRDALRRRMLEARFGPERGKLIHAYNLDRPKRGEDVRTLWGVWNCIQERAINGQFHYATLDYPGQPTHAKQFRKARAVRSISDSVRINAQMWNALELTAEEIKTGDLVDA